MLPFTREAFLALFASYNAAVWPAQLVAYGAGVAALVTLVPRTGRATSARLVLGALAAMWLWTGVSYHWLFFAEINPAAFGFGGLFVAEALALLVLAVRNRVAFELRFDLAGSAGAGLIFYALIVYPSISLAEGGWAQSPAFGITPCPVTLFTLGFLLLAAPRPPLWAWIIPLSWSLIGGTAAFLLGIVQDWILLLSGPAAILLAFGAPRVAAVHEGKPGR